MERLTVNLTGRLRRDMLGGRKYAVAPVTMIVEGVLNGSKGPLFYPDEELRKDPKAWNHMPIVVYHPTTNGVHVSARDPHVLNVSGVGSVFNSSYDAEKKRLTAEAWFDEERVDAVDDRILQALEAGKQVELSTGLFTDNEPAEEGAAHNGKAYQYVARNYRPDHLAILPDQVGACSVKDGCGVLVNSELDIQKLIKEEFNKMDKKKVIDYLITNCSCWEEEDRKTLEALSDEKLAALKANTERIVQESVVANAARKGFEDDNVSFTWNSEKNEFEATVKAKKEEPPMANTEKKEPPKPKTLNEYLDDLPEPVKVVVNRSLAKEKAERDDIIERITGNKKNKLTKEQLGAMSTDQLEGIAALIVEERPKPNYTGAASPAGASLAANEDLDEPLPLPTINWEEIGKNK